MCTRTHPRDQAVTNSYSSHPRRTRHQRDCHRQSLGLASLSSVLNQGAESTKKVNAVCGVPSTLSQFSSMAIFVQDSGSRAENSPWSRSFEGSREEVVEACTAGLMHEFVRDLPEWYDTKLGTGGASLSGGQTQRARERSCEASQPYVLVLGEMPRPAGPVRHIETPNRVASSDRELTVEEHNLLSPAYKNKKESKGNKAQVYIIKGYTEMIESELAKTYEGISTSSTSTSSPSTSGESTIFYPNILQKAFNASPAELESLSSILDKGATSTKKVNAVWGVTSALSQFSSMAMFVQGFWFGSKLMCIPQFVILARGKFAMVSLVTLINPPIPLSQPPPPPPHPTRIPLPIRITPHTRLPTHTHRIRRKIALQTPTATAPQVGGSGSGKSTIAQLLARLYTPNPGAVQLDNQDIEYLDEDQSCIMFEGSVHDNIAMGVAGAGEGARRPEDVSREEVVEACTAALMHEFVRDLPEGYDTKLGTGGASLSGGQKQRLAIARAKLRDPTVLVLDEATSALDATSRILVFEAIKTWWRNKTTIVITHDLSQITPQDFVYTPSPNGTTTIPKAAHIVKKRLSLQFTPTSPTFSSTSIYSHSRTSTSTVTIEDDDAVFGGDGRCWLTLAGFAIGPVFTVTMTVQANVVARVELHTKRAREEVAKGYYEHISNVRAIRAMSFETVFQEQYDKSVAKAHKTGVQGAFVEGCTYGISSALIHLAEALVFYVGAVL
ncbi:hypothetical protein BD410DRAFT_810506, partial [Rickenella mellea]